jgi:hypothetical protein
VSQLEVRQAHEHEAAQIFTVTDGAIRRSAAGYYDPPALDTWASGGSEEGVRRIIRRAHVVVGVIDGAVVGWSALLGEGFERFGFTERQRLNRNFNGQTFAVVSMTKELVRG